MVAKQRAKPILQTCESESAQLVSGGGVSNSPLKSCVEYLPHALLDICSPSLTPVLGRWGEHGSPGPSRQPPGHLGKSHQNGKKYGDGRKCIVGTGAVLEIGSQGAPADFCGARGFDLGSVCHLCLSGGSHSNYATARSKVRHFPAYIYAARIYICGIQSSC